MKLRQRSQILLSTVALFLMPADGRSQDELPPGFHRVTGQYVDVITDFPLTEPLRELPRVFDAAVPLWCEAFDVHPDRVKGWHVEAFVMRARERFIAAGFLDSKMSEFPYGFQWGDRLWVSEQTTHYYHRHLLLHEGTHWFMSRHFGGNGPPWLMEGLAEWYGTHRWDGERLQMGIVPTSRQDVPGWGRISLIREQLEIGVAPTLETVLRYDERAHRQAEAYAWSWAAALFFQHHPRAQATFKALLKQPMRPDATMTRWLFKRLRGEWPQLRSAWSAMLSDLEYGFDPTRRWLQFSDAHARLQPRAPKHLTIAADQGWQPSGIVVRAGEQVQVVASGEFSVAQLPKPWQCTPEGVTLEYHAGWPLGRLMAMVAAPIDAEPDFAEPVSATSIGSQGKVRVERAGELFFRINETSAGLADNAGSISLQLSN